MQPEDAALQWIDNGADGLQGKNKSGAYSNIS